MTLQIKRVPLADLHEDPANVRVHPERNMVAIGASLQQFGQVEPLVVQQGIGKVVGGNGRLGAMRALGWIMCDIVEVPLTDIEATALAIALNNPAMQGDFDFSMLADELVALDTGTFDLPAATGFSMDDLASIAEYVPEPEHAPESKDGPKCPACGRKLKQKSAD